ncbi:hypothetical protein FOZ63_033865, partial [Perkinsus olseni]
GVSSLLNVNRNRCNSPAASTFIANAREGLTPGKYLIPPAAHLNIDLHYNGVEVTKDGRIILKRDGSVPSPAEYPFVETRFDLKVRPPVPQWPNEPEAVYVLPWDGFRIKLT